MWHVNPVVIEEGVDVAETKCEAAAKPPTTGGTGRDFAEATATQSHNLMATAATRVWEELYITKKPAIEEVINAHCCFLVKNIFACKSLYICARAFLCSIGVMC